MASYANIVIDQGANFEATISLEDENQDPFNLTGYTVTGQIRRTYKSATAYDFSINVANADEGQIVISLTANQTALIKAGRYVFDINAKSLGGVITRALEGMAEITPSVTRSV
jgi:hypothetical protein